jgi:hypothetical protein
LQVCPFQKRSLVTDVIKTHLLVTEQGRFQNDTRVKKEFNDLLSVLKLPLTKGDGKEGWIAFSKFFNLAEKESLSLSLHIEDAFGGTHESQITNIPIGMGHIAL